MGTVTCVFFSTVYPVHRLKVKILKLGRDVLFRRLGNMSTLWGLKFTIFVVIENVVYFD